jgi:osmoprotectant transport system substrate-binding protein
MIVDYIGGSQAELAPDAAPSGDPDEVMEIITEAYRRRSARRPSTTRRPSTAMRSWSAATWTRRRSRTSQIMGLVLGASAQCPERPQCLIGLEDPDIYGIEFAGFVTLEFGPLLGEALAADEVDAVIWNTTAPQITERGFKVLEDDQGLFPAQNIAPIISTELLEAYGDQLVADINELSAMITTDDLLAWNTETDIEFRESDAVAREWLESKGLI